MGAFICLFLALLVIFLIVIVGIGIHQYRAGDKRLADLRLLAEEHQWGFDDGREGRVPKYLQREFASERWVQNTFVGKHKERCFQMGDFHVRTGKGKKSRHGVRSYCFVETNEAQFIPVSITPETIFDKATQAAGLEDINFESAEFSDKFSVTSEDRKFAYSVVTPKMMEFLLKHSKYEVHLDADGVVVDKSFSLPWQADEFNGMLDFANEVLKHIPPMVWDKCRVAARSGGARQAPATRKAN